MDLFKCSSMYYTEINALVMQNLSLFVIDSYIVTYVWQDDAEPICFSFQW